MDEPNKNNENCQERPMNTNFEELFYQSPIGILLYDKEGKLTNANDSALHIARIPKLDNVLGTNIFDNPLLASKKDELHEKGLIKFQDSLNLFQIKEQNIYNPVEPKIIDIDWTVSVTDSGYLIQIQDITKQKFVEDSLKESESTLRGFFDATGDMRGIIDVISDNDVRHIADNVVTAGYVGITPDMMRSKLGSELGEPEEILHRWIKHYKESERTGKPVSFEYLDKRENNEAWLIATVNYIGTNRQGQPRYAYVVRDITEHKEAEYELKVSEEKYRKIIDVANEGIMMADPSGIITLVNAKMAEMLGYTIEELVGTDSLSLVDNDEVVYGKKKIENRDKGIRESYEIKYRRKSGEELWCLINATPIYDDNSKHIANMTMQTDITKRKEREKLSDALNKVNTIINSSLNYNEIMNSIV